MADKLGHAWKWRSGTGYAVCPWCGIEQKQALVGAKGGSGSLFRRVGSGGKWTPKKPRCRRVIGARLVYRKKPVTWLTVMLAWPPRFQGRDAAGRKVIVPVLAYWRARRTAPALRAMFARATGAR